MARENQVTVVCPNRAMYVNANKSWSIKTGYENLHIVSAQGYSTCNATGGKLVLQCDKPEPLQYVTLGSYSDPVVFKPGSTYYFIGKIYVSCIRVYLLLLNFQSRILRF